MKAKLRVLNKHYYLSFMPILKKRDVGGRYPSKIYFPDLDLENWKIASRNKYFN